MRTWQRRNLASLSVGSSVHCLVVCWNMGYRGELCSLLFCICTLPQCCSTPPVNACRSHLVLRRSGATVYSPREGGCIYFFILRYFSCFQLFFLILSLLPTESILQQLWEREHWVMNSWAHKEQKAVSPLLATQAASGPCWLNPLWVWLIWDVFKSCVSVRHIKLPPFPPRFNNLT